MKFLSAIVSIALLLGGCATQAPPYQASIDNVQALQRAQATALNIGTVVPETSLGTATSISLRGNPMSSSVGVGYADYLAAALKQELELAKLLDPKSATQVSAVLTKNDIAAGGISTNSGEIAAVFTVKRDGAVRYEATKEATLTWESSFVGAIAIPLAQQNYPRLVQKLLTELFTDPAFAAACK